MRPYVSRLDTNAMQWQKTDTAGLLTKSLSLDSETGARTAIQRMDVGQGYEPYPSAHFHHVDEELFFIKGSFTFDGRRAVARADVPLLSPGGDGPRFSQ